MQGWEMSSIFKLVFIFCDVCALCPHVPCSRHGVHVLYMCYMWFSLSTTRALEIKPGSLGLAKHLYSLSHLTSPSCTIFYFILFFCCEPTFNGEPSLQSPPTPPRHTHFKVSLLLTWNLPRKPGWLANEL